MKVRLKSVATARRSQQDVGAVVGVVPSRRRADPAGLFFGHDAATRQESCGKPKIDMRRAHVRVDLVRVEVLTRLAVKLQVDRIAPVDEVFRVVRAIQRLPSRNTRK